MKTAPATRRKPGRPATGRPHYVRRLISLEPDVDAELTKLQRRYNLSRSGVIARLIEQALEITQETTK